MEQKKPDDDTKTSDGKQNLNFFPDVPGNEI